MQPNQSLQHKIAIGAAHRPDHVYLERFVQIRLRRKRNRRLLFRRVQAVPIMTKEKIVLRHRWVISIGQRWQIRNCRVIWPSRVFSVEAIDQLRCYRKWWGDSLRLCAERHGQHERCREATSNRRFLRWRYHRFHLRRGSRLHQDIRPNRVQSGTKCTRGSAQISCLFLPDAT